MPFFHPKLKVKLEYSMDSLQSYLVETDLYLPLNEISIGFSLPFRRYVIFFEFFFVKNLQDWN